MTRALNLVRRAVTDSTDPTRAMKGDLPGVTKAIQDNSYAALKGDVDVETALKDMSDAIKSASGG